MVWLPLMMVAPTDQVVVGYVTNARDLAAYTPKIDFKKVTHLNVAFENPVDDQGNLSFDAQDAVLLQAAHAAKIKVLVSIGGGGIPEDPVVRGRYERLLKPENLTSFVQRLTNYLKAHHFDGLDVDLEGPCITPDYGPFVLALSDALRKERLLLTAAVSRGYGGANIPDPVLQRFDLVNIMAYDATGPWNLNNPGQHSSFDFAKENVEYWLKRGVPKVKAVLGVPFYGYGFGEVAKKRTEFGYADIVAAYPGADKLDQVDSTIWYNGVPTIELKAKYVREQNLRGIMIWVMDFDAAGDASLLSAIQRGLGRRTR